MLNNLNIYKNYAELNYIYFIYCYKTDNYRAAVELYIPNLSSVYCFQIRLQWLFQLLDGRFLSPQDPLICHIVPFPIPWDSCTSCLSNKSQFWLLDRLTILVSRVAVWLCEYFSLLDWCQCGIHWHKRGECALFSKLSH